MYTERWCTETDVLAYFFGCLAFLVPAFDSWLLEKIELLLVISSITHSTFASKLRVVRRYGTVQYHQPLLYVWMVTIISSHHAELLMYVVVTLDERTGVRGVSLTTRGVSLLSVLAQIRVVSTGVHSSKQKRGRGWVPMAFMCSYYLQKEEGGCMSGKRASDHHFVRKKVWKCSVCYLSWVFCAVCVFWPHNVRTVI